MCCNRVLEYRVPAEPLSELAGSSRKYQMTTSPRLLLLIALLFAVAYVGTLALQTYPGDFVVKSIPAVCLSVLALRAVPGLRPWDLRRGRT
jgi:hypothetical protein